MTAAVASPPRAHGMPVSPSGQWATFRLAGELFALRVEDVQEVMMLQPLTRVPLAPPYVIGLLNLRGHVVPAIDARLRLGLPARSGDEGKMVVVHAGDHLEALIVDEIGDVLALDRRCWSLPPETMPAAYRAIVFGICTIERHVLLGVRAEALVGDGEGGGDGPH